MEVKSYQKPFEMVRKMSVQDPSNAFKTDAVQPLCEL